MTWEYVFIFVIGMTIGVIGTLIIKRTKTATGEMVIDFNDPTKDTYCLDLYEPITTLHTKKQIVLNVKVNK